MAAHGQKTCRVHKHRNHVSMQRWSELDPKCPQTTLPNWVACSCQPRHVVSMSRYNCAATSYPADISIHITARYHESVRGGESSNVPFISESMAMSRAECNASGASELERVVGWAEGSTYGARHGDHQTRTRP